ncbi:MAG: host-nuclease inhibitor Gam family protein [Bacteroidota bacterium]
MTKRISNTLLQGISQTEYEEALKAYATADAHECTILARMDAEILRIREKYATELSYCNTKKKNTFDIIQTYCREQKELLFSKRRSCITPYGTVGFRLGTPKLKPLSGHNWESILQQLKEKLPAYVRCTEEPAKDVLLADRYTELVAGNLYELGLQIVQDEIFFFDLKRPTPAIS